MDDVDSFYSIDVEVNVAGSKDVLDITSEAEGSIDDKPINIQELDKPILIKIATTLRQVVFTFLRNTTTD